MSYIAFELDALNVAPAAARSAGVTEEVIIAGLVRMWAWCFREKTDTITADQLRGHFGSDVASALVAFRFLEAQAGAWRVRGAQRYLRISEARSKGGKAAAGNLKRGALQPGVQPGVSPGSSPAPAGSQPGGSPGCAPALTPSTEHRAPSTETKKIPPPQKPATDPRHAPLVSAFNLAFQAQHGRNYPYEKRDFARVTALLARASPEDLLTAWRKALANAGFPTIATLEDFSKHLPRFIGTGPPSATRGPAPVADWTNATHGEVPA